MDMFNNQQLYFLREEIIFYAAPIKLVLGFSSFLILFNPATLVLKSKAPKYILHIIIKIRGAKDNCKINQLEVLSLCYTLFKLDLDYLQIFQSNYA